MIKIALSLILVSTVSLVSGADLTQLIQETQKVAQSDRQISFVWWMPQVFWENNFEQNPGMTEGQKEDILKRLKEYSIVNGTKSAP